MLITLDRRACGGFTYGGGAGARCQSVLTLTLPSIDRDRANRPSVVHSSNNGSGVTASNAGAASNGVNALMGSGNGNAAHGMTLNGALGFKATAGLPLLNLAKARGSVNDAAALASTARTHNGTIPSTGYRDARMLTTLLLLRYDTRCKAKRDSAAHRLHGLSRSHGHCRQRCSECGQRVRYCSCHR